MCTDNLKSSAKVGEVGKVKMENNGYAKRATGEGLLCRGDRRVSLLWAVMCWQL